MFNKLILFIIFAFFSLIHSQEKSSDNIVGKNYGIKSDQLNELINIQVFLPKGYNENENQKYDTFYVLDGCDNYYSALSSLDKLSKYNYTPSFIVVSIVMEGENRYTLLYDTDFIKLLEDDIIKFIDNNYKVSKNRLIFGWESTGGFVLDVLTKKPELFSGYIAASPTPILGEYFPMMEKEFNELSKVINSEKVNNKYLFVTQSHDDFPVNYGMENLIKLLEENDQSLLRWKYMELKNEKHPTTPYNTIFHGLKNYYYNYSPYQMKSYKEFVSAGGFEYLDEYYINRAKRFGFSKEETDEAKKKTRRSLVLTSIYENNFEAFEILIEKFEQEGFWEEQYLAHAYWCGRFYLENNKPIKAKEVFENLNKKHSDNARPLNGLGLVYEKLGELDKSLTYFEKAVTIGKSNDDWRLKEYQNNLERIINKK